MTARRGLSRAAVIEAATDLVESDGLSALSVASLASRLGIRPPSLYNHIDNLDRLRRDVALGATIDLGDDLRDAVMGRVGRDALRTAGRAFRSYARAHPGLYQLTTEARPHDDEFATASLRAVEPVLAILRSFGLDQDESVHAARTLRAALHGFVSLENAKGFGLEVDVDSSFDWMVGVLAVSLEATPPTC